MRRFSAACGVVLACIVTAAASEPVNEEVVARIKMEGFQDSKVMDTVSWLSDVYGPRLSGSDNLRHAAEWVRARMTEWGLAHAALEPYDTTYRGWTLDQFSLEMSAPQYMRIQGYPMAWSPALAPVTGTPILVEVKTPTDFEKYRGKLRGRIVMNGRPDATDVNFEPDAKRLTAEELRKQSAQTRPGAPASLQEEEEEFNGALDRRI